MKARKSGVARDAEVCDERAPVACAFRRRRGGGFRRGGCFFRRRSGSRIPGDKREQLAIARSGRGLADGQPECDIQCLRGGALLVVAGLVIERERQGGGSGRGIGGYRQLGAHRKDFLVHRQGGRREIEGQFLVLGIDHASERDGRGISQPQLGGNQKLLERGVRIHMPRMLELELDGQPHGIAGRGGLVVGLDGIVDLRPRHAELRGGGHRGE